ncbi:hsp70-binding protein 1 [Periplaneta americana]|uniref:hsp70-binding protein 1 n=1 Tax=Periplaneta americana TaxID=6978 RepID=UPI0037E7D7CA
MASERGTGDGSENMNSNNPRIMGALQYPTPEERNVTVQPNQPRQPHNLQDLLRFSVEASTTGQNASNQSTQFIPGPMDEERKTFLENTLKSMTVDVIEMLIEAINVLKRAGNLELEDDPTESEQALEQIAAYVDNMDTANDFHKIGGFCIFRPCLDSAHGSLRWRAAEIIAELTQNNPYCQERVLEAGLLPVLLSLVDIDPNPQVRVKALYALSCLIRENDLALEEFGRHEGYSILLRAMQSHVEKLQIKSAFLLTYICGRKPAIRDELFKMGFVEQLVGLVSAGRQPALEHLLSALLALVENHPPSLNECRQPQLQLRSILRNLFQENQGKEDRQEEHEYTKNLLRIVFSGETEEER